MSQSPSSFRLFLTTAGSEEQAEQLARALVERRLAACVNVVGATCSTYRWKGEVVQEEEKLLIIKSAERLFEDVRRTIRELHSYEVPELLSLPIGAGDVAYLGWLESCLAPE
jgi:periplasmic divalent cation tolerance protein